LSKLGRKRSEKKARLVRLGQREIETLGLGQRFWSDLYHRTASDLTESDAILVLNVGGVDDNSAQQLYARHIYYPGDIRWQHRYKDITSVSPQGRLLLDYTKFHDTVPE